MRNTSENQIENRIEVYLLRHGKTAGNLEKRYIGRTDEDLCDEGIRELQGKTFPKMNRIYVSPMKRCLETVTVFFPEQEAEVREDLREIDFGEFEGKNYLELSGNEKYQKWIDSNGTLPFPGGESREAFMDRTVEEMTGVLKAYLQERVEETERQVEEECIAFVVHGGTIMAFLSNYCDGDY